MPPDKRAGPKLRSGVRTSRNGSSLIGCCGVCGWRVQVRSEAGCRRCRRRVAAAGAALRAFAAAIAGAAAAPLPAVADHADDGADRRDFAGRHADFAEHAGFGRRHFHRHLVGLDLEQIVARLDRVAGRLEPVVILPSATVSPSCGIRIFISIPDGRLPDTDTYCVSKNSIMPSWAPSRPRPDCLMPPNGAAGSETMPRLSPIMPKSSFSETRSRGSNPWCRDRRRDRIRCRWRA